MATTKASLALLGLLAVGCQAVQDEASVQGKRMVASAQASMQEGLRRASQEAAQIRDNVSQSALDGMRQKLVELQAQLANAKAPTEQLDAVRAQIAQLDAQKRWQETREAMTAKLREAEQLKERAEKTTEDVQQKLAEADAAYRKMKQQADEAQAAFEDAKSRATKAWEDLKGQP